MAIVDSLNEIIAKNGGEVSGRGGTIENKLKTLSELSMGGGGGKVYDTTVDTYGDMHFSCNPFEIKPGDSIRVIREATETRNASTTVALFDAIGQMWDKGIGAIRVVCHTSADNTTFTSDDIPVDEEGVPTQPYDNISFKSGK